jgi:hypothetical protein
MKKAEDAAQNNENELYKITTILSNRRLRITERMGGTSIKVASTFF